MGLLVALTTIPVFLSIAEDQPHLHSGAPSHLSTTPFPSVYQHALQSPIFIKGTKQNKKASFGSITISSYHLISQLRSKTSQELPTLVSHFLTCHSLLKPPCLGHSPYHVSKSAFVKSMSELQVVSPMVNSLSLSCMTSHHQLVMAEPFSSKILPTSLVDPLPFLLLLFFLFAQPPSTEYPKTPS